jgi:hypothetical protein
VFVAVTTTPTIMGLMVFLTYTVLLDHELSPSKGFAAVALIELLKMPLVMLPNSINIMVQAVLSLKRIERFLNAPEVRGLKSSIEDRPLRKG